MIAIPTWVKQIGGWQWLVVAAALILLPALVLGRGLLASVLFIAGLAVLLVVVINYLSYGR